MLKNLRRLVACVNDFKNKLLMIKILLNVINIFIFSMMQLLKKNSIKSIIMIHCQNTLRFKKFCIQFKENTFNSSARNKWKCMFKHAIFINASKFLVINFIKN